MKELEITLWVKKGVCVQLTSEEAKEIFNQLNNLLGVKK